MKKKIARAIYDFTDITTSALVFYVVWVAVMFCWVKGIAQDVGLPDRIASVSHDTAAVYGTGCAMVLFALSPMGKGTFSRYGAFLIGRILLACGYLSFIVADRVNAWISGGMFAFSDWDISIVLFWAGVWLVNNKCRSIIEAEE